MTTPNTEREALARWKPHSKPPGRTLSLCRTLRCTSGSRRWRRGARTNWPCRPDPIRPANGTYPSMLCV
jgi:hypothetical protein